MGTWFNGRMTLSKSVDGGSIPSVPADIMKKISLPKITFGIPVAFVSLEIYSGMIIGYFLARFFSPRLKSLVFHFGNYKVHLHHWLLGLVAFAVLFFYKFSFLPIQFSYGFLGGVVFQGIVCYPDWYKFLIKKYE